MCESRPQTIRRFVPCGHNRLFGRQLNLNMSYFLFYLVPTRIYLLGDKRVGLIPVKIKLVYDPYGHSSGTGIFVLYLNRHETFLALSIFYFYYGSQLCTMGTRI